VRLLDFNGLAQKGIKFSDTHLLRLIDAGKFPKPVRFGGGKRHWVESEIDEYITRLLKQREDAAA
jgi:prophage regulatory protein